MKTTSRMAVLFEQLEAPAGDVLLTGVRIDQARPYHLAKDSSGDPALLVELQRTDSAFENRPTRLRHLEYLPCVSATVRDANAGTIHNGEFIVLRCRDSDSELRRHFFRMLDGIIEHLGNSPSQAETSAAVRELVELFRAMSSPSRGTIMGLWSELLIIAESSNPELVAAAWHTDPWERHDFACGLDRIEVKSTVKEVREHDITLEQLSVPEGGTGLLVSFLLMPSDIGSSVSDLLADVASRISGRSEILSRLRTVIAHTIGSDWRELERVRFDRRASYATMRVFDMRKVPCVDPRVPAEVSRVRFAVDLSGVLPIEKNDAALSGPLIWALLASGDSAKRT